MVIKSASKIISIVNMKGGVGKTSICLNLAYWLAEKKGKKVLVVDFDPQSNISEGLLTFDKYKSHVESKKVISDIFTDLHKIVGPVSDKKEKLITLEDMVCNVKKYQNGGKIDLIPSELELCQVLERPIGKMSETRLKLILKDKKDKYDFVLIDCGPTYSLLTTNALNASNYVLIPVKPDSFSIRGIPLMVKQIETHNRASDNQDKVKICGIVFTLVKKLKYVDSIKGEVLRVHKDIFPVEIKYSEHYPIGTIKNLPIYKTTARKKYIANFEEFVTEFMKRIEEDKNDKKK
jgi:chromosome partitioning protein